ncbi:hypothetical protein [Mycolicibacterium elephantis]|uniref:hypothetical protein n=1 Tax=Mycolicibacterium elephantis TaxID=81858 RepID=UPI001055C963|nr:hypothetical protein [Mycolicibacterium elephantis]
MDNLDDPADPWMEVQGLVENELTQAERDLRNHAVRVRRADGTELLAVFTVCQPVLRIGWPGIEFVRDADGTYAIVVP